METIIKIIIGIIIVFAIGGWLLSNNGEKEDGAKLGAALGAGLILRVLPTVIVIVFVVLIIRACT